MENVVTIIFEDENESYRAFSELKSDLVSLPCIIAQIVLLKKQDGRLIVRDGAGIDAYGDTRRGGLLGLFVGILGGPIGVLLGGAVGSMIGMAMDTSEARKNLSLIEQVSFDLQDGDAAIIALAQEADEKALNARLSPYKVEIIRREAADVAAEIEQALKVQKELEEEARHRLHIKKESEFKNLIQQKREELKSDFESLKEKLKKDL